MGDEAIRKLRHDLRTPLNQIIGYGELLAEEAEDRGDAGLVSDLGKIVGAARALVGHVDTLVASLAGVALAPPVSHPPSPPDADPSFPPSEADGPTSLETDPPGEPTDDASLLVVDDDERNRDMLARRLSRCGYQVTLAEDGRAALDAVSKARPDLVLLDVMMPGISGVAVLEQLRRDHPAAALPVIMATARGDSADIVKALRLGANDYVTKPLDFPVVLARVRTQLALKRANDKVRRLAAELAARNRFIRSTFGRYVSDEVAATVLESPEGLRLGGETRRVSILMSDLRGFTSVVESHPAESVVELLNHYLGVMADVIHAHGGTIVEFLGDGIFVVFGAPIAREDDAARALACAIAMQLAMSEVDVFNRAHELPTLEMGIAVNTGDVVVGNIGSHTRAKYGVVGSAVNLTSRIESLTVGGQVLTSAATLADAGAIVRVGRRRSVRVKGAVEPLEVCEVLGLEGTWGLDLPRVETHLTPLATPLPVKLLVIEGKLLGDEGHDAQIVELCERAAVVSCVVTLEELTDVRLVLEEGAHAYAKITEVREGTLVARFTLVSAAAAVLMRKARG